MRELSGGRCRLKVTDRFGLILRAGETNTRENRDMDPTKGHDVECAFRLSDGYCTSRQGVRDKIDSVSLVGVAGCLSERFLFLTARTRRSMEKRVKCSNVMPSEY